MFRKQYFRGDVMTNINNLDKEAKEYFYSLPSVFQTQIIESGVTLSSREDIERFYKLVQSENISMRNYNRDV